MTLKKRLAAGLLAMVTAVGATISAGAAYTNPESYYRHQLYESREQCEDGGYILHGSHYFFLRYLNEKEFETVETLTDLGAIENYGDPEKETSILIPASQLENYPVNTIAILHAQITSGTGYVRIYPTDGKRDGLLQESYCSTYAGDYQFIITKEMKENGILLTGCEVEEERELSDVSAVTVQSVQFTNGVAAEYEWKSHVLDTLKYGNISLADFFAEFDWDDFQENPNDDDTFFLWHLPTNTTNHDRATVILPDELSNLSVGDFLAVGFHITKAMEADEDHFDLTYSIPYYDDDDKIQMMKSSGQVFFSPSSPSITDSDENDTDFFQYGAELKFIRITEEIKEYGFGITVPDYAYVDWIDRYAPSENSEIDPVDPVDPVVTPGFSSAGSSIQDVPVNTVVTQKTAVADEKYNERFVKKVAASDVVGKTKATFTLSNGTVTKTVSTTKYNTALTVDGETISAGSGYVFLVYTLSGIPEDVTVTVSDVVLE